jgi:hypothetical protein
MRLTVLVRRRYRIGFWMLVAEEPGVAFSNSCKKVVCGRAASRGIKRDHMAVLQPVMAHAVTLWPCRNNRHDLALCTVGGKSDLLQWRYYQLSLPNVAVVEA